MAEQLDKMPTNKLTAVALGTIGLQTAFGDAIRETWPQIVPAAFSGPMMTSFVASAIPTLFAALYAYYFVKDRPNAPTVEIAPEPKVLAPPAIVVSSPGLSVNPEPPDLRPR